MVPQGYRPKVSYWVGADPLEGECGVVVIVRVLSMRMPMLLLPFSVFKWYKDTMVLHSGESSVQGASALCKHTLDQD